MVELGQRLVDSKNCLTFLIECTNFSPADIRLNNNVFQWYGRMEEIFDEHRKIIMDKTEQYQEGLKVSIVDILNYFRFLEIFSFLHSIVSSSLSQFTYLSSLFPLLLVEDGTHIGYMWHHFLIFRGSKLFNTLSTNDH